MWFAYSVERNLCGHGDILALCTLVVLGLKWNYKYGMSIRSGRLNPIDLEGFWAFLNGCYVYNNSNRVS